MGNENVPAMAGLMERDLSGFAEVIEPAGFKGGTPAGGSLMIQQTSREVTARRVDVKRQIPAILQEVRQMCAAFGDTYVYSWEVNNRQKGTKDTIKGPTIKLAMMLVQAFGNCSVDMDVSETATHWTFKSWFMDYEKGTSLSRLFQQRKSQNTGMKDADRASDLVFQIGQSKAARNVVVNALSSFTSYAMEESEKGLLKKFQTPEAIDEAWLFMERTMEQHGIDQTRVEAVIGRRRKDFTIPNLAKVYMMFRGIAEGMTSADDQFPTLEAAAEMREEQEEERQEVKSRAARKKADPKPKDEAPKGEQDGGTTAPAPDAAKASETPAAPQFKETKIEKIKAAYFDAEDFETIQAIRADVAKNNYQEAPGIAKAYEDAMERVKKANAAKAAKAGEVDPVEKEQAAEVEATMKGPDQDELVERFQTMFGDAATPEEVEDARDKMAKFIDDLSPNNQTLVQGLYNAAKERVKPKAEATPAPTAPKPAPLASKAPPTMFSDDD